MAFNIDAVDVLVWGGGTGGVAAALQAARGGASTLLLTPGSWLGGMVSAAGVCCPDGNELTPWQTGLWGAFLRELERREPEGLDHNWVSCFGYRPTTAECVLQDWVHNESRLQWWPECSLKEVERQGARIQAVQVAVANQRQRIACEVVIDGSDRGDLLPLAGAAFRLGWEDQEQWDEPSAPSRQRLQSDPFFRNQPVQSPTWVVMGQLQDNPLAWPEPERNDDPSPARLPAPFEQACSAFGLTKTLTYGRLPTGLVMLNWPLHGNDWHQRLERAFGTDAQAEALLFNEMQQHSLHFAEALRDATDGRLSLGRAFPSDSGCPSPWLAPMPYWREGRRMVGQSTVIEQHLLPQDSDHLVGKPPMDDSGTLQAIAIGNYANDHHYPGEDWPLAPKSCRWGGRWTGTPFSIPYGALVSAEIDNLLAADKAFSTSHMANGATRLQPLILNVGQAAGMAAALAVETATQPSALSVRALQMRLINDAHAPSAVVPLWDTPWHHTQWRQRQIRALDRHQLEPASLQTHRAGAVWQGWIHRDDQGGFRFEQTGQESIPLITLEPAVHDSLEQIDASRSVTLDGIHNPWGPWLRVTSID